MILLMGIPGSGKGTQGKLLADTLGYHILSTGDLLRAQGTADQHERMQRGEILGDEEVTELLDKALKELDDQNKTILDGYPRRVGQAEWLLENQQDRFELQQVIYLVASRDAVKKRLQNRGRTDDQEETVEARFTEYEELTLPILNYLKSRDVAVVEVNAEQPIEDVHQEILLAHYNQRHKV